jgi:hypothetical protein
MAMGISRLLYQNIFFWLTSGLKHGVPPDLDAQNWDDVKIVAAYPDNVDALFLPTVAVDRNLIVDDPLELGTQVVMRTDSFVLSVFAERDGQRDDLAEYVKEIFDSRSKTFLDFNDGFSPEGGQSSLGVIHFEFVGMFPIREVESRTRAGRHRMDVRVEAEYIYDPT